MRRGGGNARQRPAATGISRREPRSVTGREARAGGAARASSRQTSARGRRLYVYAIVDCRLPRLRIAGRTLETVPVGDLYAIAQRVGQAPPISEQALRDQYDIVVELTACAPAILPARFGALLDPGELTRIVTLRHQQLALALDLVRNREQMTVRLIAAVPEEVSAGRRMVPAAAGPGTHYLEERRTAAGYPLPAAAAKLTEAVRQLVVAEKAEPGDGDVRAMLYHLIDRRSTAAYCRALFAAAATVEFSVKVTGPWPPFAFVPELLA